MKGSNTLLCAAIMATIANAVGFFSFDVAMFTSETIMCLVGANICRSVEDK